MDIDAPLLVAPNTLELKLIVITKESVDSLVDVVFMSHGPTTRRVKDGTTARGWPFTPLCWYRKTELTMCLISSFSKGGLQRASFTAANNPVTTGSG